MPEPAGFVVKNGTKRFAVFGRPGPFVGHGDLDVPVGAAPGDRRAAARLERRVGGVADEVDEELLELVGVRRDGELRPAVDADGNARLESGDARDQRRRARRAKIAAAAGARGSRRRR